VRAPLHHNVSESYEALGCKGKYHTDVRKKTNDILEIKILATLGSVSTLT
jgi:hypothetical protein